MKAGMSTEIKDLIATKHFGFLGSGKMAQALASGFLASGCLKGSQVTMTDVFGTSGADAKLFEPIKQLQMSYGIEYMQCNKTMGKKSDVIFACVKPNIIISALEEMSSCLDNKLIVTIAAGITTNRIKKVVPDSTRIIRIMPNTPCLVQCGTGIFCRGPGAVDQDVELVKSLCSTTFPVFEEVPESLINPASAVSGSGPAYIYMIAEAMADGGVLVGIPRPVAHRLAVSTILGAATMMLKTEEEPGKLKNDVCSAGGTTICAVKALEDGGVRAAFINAVKAATDRSAEMTE
ncbi:unnamed protein product [Calicophoron daubneyi]|uniref:Pyrroline-5-carboxylate reductase n=1 Tax=Calicophoron daubneyi TaxID=300641 RepID=A0AAV2TWS3_CALDB